MSRRVKVNTLFPYFAQTVNIIIRSYMVLQETFKSLNRMAIQSHMISPIGGFCDLLHRKSLGDIPTNIHKTPLTTCMATVTISTNEFLVTNMIHQPGIFQTENNRIVIFGPRNGEQLNNNVIISIFILKFTIYRHGIRSL